MLSLPESWEAILEEEMLKRPIGFRCERIYICSPCRADTAKGVIRNMKAARVYMFYAYIHFAGVPKAPHAYLPVLLSDNYEDERDLALRFGARFLKSCDKLFVCGDRLSSGMYGEITEAINLGVPVQVFNRQVYDELRANLEQNGIDTEAVWHEDDNQHFTLSWGANELAPYWEDDHNA
jgi:hypothetical protein